MRAVAFLEFGADPVRTELPTPEPGPGEVLVEVRASSVNGFDLGVLGGHLKGVYEYEFPVVLGKDFAGVVAAAGEAVTSVEVGDRVFGVVMRSTLGQGGFAEYVVVDSRYGVARMPEGLDHARAGVLGLAGTAALNAVDAIDPRPGEIVLISGATGGVGAYAVQLVVARGASVIATAEKGAQAAFVTALGATWAVDPADLVAQVGAIAPNGIQAALHLAGDGDVVAGLISPGGRLASTLHFQPDGLDLKSTTVMADPSPETLTNLATAVIEGRLRVPVAQTYPLADSVSALGDFAAGTVGKLAVTIWA
jgi:NADPH:quinone reductase-like Zn-dependent oxidoreductase